MSMATYVADQKEKDIAEAREKASAWFEYNRGNKAFDPNIIQNNHIAKFKIWITYQFF